MAVGTCIDGIFATSAHWTYTTWGLQPAVGKKREYKSFPGNHSIKSRLPRPSSSPPRSNHHTILYPGTKFIFAHSAWTVNRRLSKFHAQLICLFFSSPLRTIIVQNRTCACNTFFVLIFEKFRNFVKYQYSTYHKS